MRLQEVSYPVLSQHSSWKAHHLVRILDLFSEGQFVAERGGEIVGFSGSLIVPSGLALRPHRFRDITRQGTFDAFDPKGDTLYGIEIMVHPAHRRTGLARAFYNRRFALIRRKGLRYFAAGGRLPGYGAVQSTVSVENYVEEVVAGTRVDRVLSAQLRSGLRVLRIMPDYLNDPSSANYAALLVWENPGARIEKRATKRTRKPRRSSPAPRGGEHSGAPRPLRSRAARAA